MAEEPVTEICEKCGRSFYPKQAWMHEPVCRYVEKLKEREPKRERD